MQGRADVASGTKLLAEPGVVHALPIVVQAGVRFAALQGVEDGLGGDHAGLHGRVGALDLQHVQEAGVVADDQGAGHAELRQRLPTALDDGAGTVGNPLAARQHVGEEGVVLQALQLVERRQMRILVGEIDDETKRHLVVLLMVEERTHAGPAQAPKRPADVVQHAPVEMPIRIDIPKFLEADGVVLSAGGVAQLELLHELLAEVPPAAFGEQRVAGVQFVARLESRLGFAIGVAPHVRRGHPFDAAVFVVEHFGGGEAGEHVDTGILRLLAQPAA